MIRKETEARIVKMTLDGESQANIAKAVGVTERTVRMYQAKNTGVIREAEEARRRSYMVYASRQGRDDFDLKVSLARIMPKVIKRIEELIPVEEDLNKLKGIAALFHEMEQCAENGCMREQSSELVKRLRNYSISKEN